MGQGQRSPTHPNPKGWRSSWQSAQQTNPGVSPGLWLRGLSASADLGLENIYFCSLATLATAVGVERGKWDTETVTALASL